MTERDLLQPQFDDSDQIDYRALILKYFRYWYLFVISVLLCLLAAYLYIRYSTPMYSISTTLLIKDDKKGGDLLNNPLLNDLDLFNSTKNVDNEVEVLKSKGLMQRVLKELSLETSYYREGNIRDVELYGENLPINVVIGKLDSAAYKFPLTLHLKGKNRFELEDEEGNISSHTFGKEIKKPYGIFTILAESGLTEENPNIIIRFHDLKKLAGHYNEQLEVTTVSKVASVIVLSLTDAVPEKGKDILNKLVELYNQEALEDKNLMALNTVEFIDDRLKFLTAELSVVEKDVETYKQRNDITDVPTQAELYLQQASEYSKKLAELSVQIDVLESIEKYLGVKENHNELVPSSLSIPDPTLLRLITTFNELQLERKRMLRTAQASNPIVQNLDDQLANLKLNIQENLKNIKRGLVITKNNLQSSTAQYASKSQQVPTIERELLEISRQQSIKQGLYLYLLQKREESAVSLAATVANSRVIDSAMVADEPVSPKKMMIFLAALLVGLGLPFAGIYVKDLLNDRVQVLTDVTQLTSTPILGELANNKAGKALAVTRDNRSPLAEMFRLVRTNLQFSTAGRENKTILITSSMSGEGKTFFSINLAASLVLTGKKVLIIGFDLRKPKLLQDMGLSDGIGITNYLVSDKVFLDDIIRPSNILPNLYVIGSGPVPPNPAELMMSTKVEILFAELRHIFDFILIDTAPVGQVADAFTLAPYIDSSIYVVRYNYTYKNQLQIIDDIYKKRKLNYPMLVLNDAKKENASGYGYGYGYGYGEEYNDNNRSLAEI